MKKKRKVWIGILIAIGAVSTLIVAALAVFIILFFTGGPAQVTGNVGEYRATMHKYTNEVVGKVHTGFFTFPEVIPESAFSGGEQPVFYFSYQDTWDDPTCEVYLRCRYSDEDYKAEIDRLKNSIYTLKGSGNEVENKLEFEDSGRFSHPVYKAIDCDNYSYEYAMDLGNGEIAYIYLSFKNTPASIKKVPREYLPGNYTESMRSNTYSNGGYNVYIVEKTQEHKLLDYGDKFK